MRNMNRDLHDGSQYWRRLQSFKLLPSLPASRNDDTPRAAIVTTLVRGSEAGSAKGIVWLQEKLETDGTICFDNIRLSALSDPQELEELWYQYGDIIYPFLNDKPFPILYHEGPYELIAKCSVKPGDIVLDVGANMGLFSIVANERAERVLAFEPDERARRILETNLAFNGASSVVVIPSACGHTKGSSRMSNTGGLGTAKVGPVSNDESTEAGTPISMTTIDDSVSEYGLHRVDFIKMDIEGYEPLALEGARQTITTFLPKISVCTYHDESHPRVLRSLLDQFSQSRYDYVQTRFKLHAFHRV